MFLMSEVPLYFGVDPPTRGAEVRAADRAVAEVQGYLAHKNCPPPLGHPRSLGIGLR